MTVRTRLLALIIAAAAIGQPLNGLPDRQLTADLVVLNGRVFTPGAGTSPAEAVAVAGNRILAVGSNDEIKALARPAAIVVDAHGGSILPGFNDAHLHLMSGGLGLDQVNLLDALTLRDIEEKIRVYAASRRDSAWVIGRGWYYAPFPGGLPTRGQLDALVPDRPAYMRCYDGHTGWANSRALALAGITRATPDPKGGVIVRDPETGEPTGALKESAEDLMRAVLPKPTRADRLRAIRAAIVEAHRYGITSAQNADGDDDTLSLFDEIRRAGDLAVRVSVALDVPSPFDDAALAGMERLRNRFGDDPLLKTGAAKLYIDGVIEAHTAAMLAPYANRPTAGEPLMTAADLDRIVAALDRLGWQVWIHAIGDRGVRMSLDAFERAAAANPAPALGRRHRLEHIETIDPADIPRFGRLGVLAVQQPFHANPSPSQLDVWTANIGSERSSRGWVLRSISDAGGRLAMGSDWPVVSLDPRLELHMAATRETPEGIPKGGWLPEQRIPLAAAIDAYTAGAAYASFDEDRKGTLKPGLLADIVVLSKDILSLPPERLLEAVVDWTIFDGRVVYRRL
jgi:predicted amidohydrolase YtcJ